MLQWLSVFTGVFYSMLRGIPIDALFGGPELTRAIQLSAVALVVAAVGARFALIGARVHGSDRFASEARTLSIDGVWWGFVASWAITLASVQLAGLSGQIRQLALAMSGVEQVMFFVLAYVVLSRRESYRYLAIAAVVEIGGGIGGFFADFKIPLFILFIAAVGVMARMTLGRMLVATGIVSITLLMGIVWSAIKLDYRDYVSGYSGAQVVIRPWDDRIEYLADKVSELDSYDLMRGVDLLASRVSYIEFFGYVIRRVPNNLPFEGGRLIGAAIEHIMKPRLLFPDKRPLEDDTVKTERYTGIVFHSARQTSISLGYVAEAYIDFGSPGMFIVVFFLGLTWGAIYRFFVTWIPGIFGAAMSIPVLFAAAELETGFIKLLGGMFMSFGIMALVAVFILPRVRPYLYTHRVARPTGQSENGVPIR
jgi:hypothetical protein